MEVLHVSLLVSSELFLESTHYILSQLERLGENIRVNRWIRPKDAFALVMTPGFWLLKAAIATALVFATWN
jgi:hypothetical protein